MYIDHAHLKVLLTFGSVFLSIIIGMLILGAAGPQKWQNSNYSLYNCTNNIVDIPHCAGNYPPPQNGTITWHFTLPTLGKVNEVWEIDVYPLPWNLSDSFEDQMLYSVNIYGQTTNSSWETLFFNDTQSFDWSCDYGADCLAWTMVYVESIQYSNYKMEFILYNVNNVYRNLGNIIFRFYTINSSYMVTETVVRFVYIIIGIFALANYILRMGGYPYHEWTFEQITLGILLAALFALNNPFRIFELLVSGWFFPLWGAILEAIFESLLCLFWLFTITKLRRNGVTNKYTWSHWDWAMVAIVLIYFVLAFTLYTLVDVTESKQPVLGGSATASDILFYFVALTYGTIITWALVLYLMTIPIISTKAYLAPRFVFLAVPTLFILFSVIIGIFLGTFGTYRRNATQFEFYFALYNIYCYWLLVGYWPISAPGRFENEDGSLRGAGEEESIPIFRESAKTATTTPSPIYQAPEPTKQPIKSNTDVVILPSATATSEKEENNQL